MIGKGIATIGIWAAVGVIGYHDSGGGACVALFALLATAAIWHQ